MFNDFNIAETKYFQKKIKQGKFKSYYEKIYRFIYPQLKSNPFYGNNIKKLKGKYQNVYRYKIGNVRLFYTIEKDRIIVLVLDIMLRKDSYKN